jgi:hypothetical protein
MNEVRILEAALRLLTSVWLYDLSNGNVYI